VAETALFKWRHYESEIILLCVRWYLRYSLSYRDLEEMMNERGLSVDHTTIYRWVQAYAPELERRIRPHLRLTNDSYRVDETYIKVKAMMLPKIWVLRNFGEAGLNPYLLSSTTQPLCKTRAFNRSRLARPYICRFNILSRVICPSTCPLLQGERSASCTAH
jgi:hypothetical protein